MNFISNLMLNKINWKQNRKAKALLKKKKFYETNLDRTEGQLDNIGKDLKTRTK